MQANISESKTFRHNAKFGKRIKFYAKGLMLNEGIDIYFPPVDDKRIDAIVRRGQNIY
jgi:hypothetical protein